MHFTTGVFSAEMRCVRHERNESTRISFHQHVKTRQTRQPWGGKAFSPNPGCIWGYPQMAVRKGRMRKGTLSEHSRFPPTACNHFRPQDSRSENGRLGIGNGNSVSRFPFCVPERSFAKRSFGGTELFLWFAEMMCSAGRKIGEIDGSVAHHLPMMCTRDTENGFRARVSASNAIHPPMMCSGGGEKSKNRPAHCTSSPDGVHDTRRKAPNRKGSCTALSTESRQCLPPSGLCLRRKTSGLAGGLTYVRTQPASVTGAERPSARSRHVCGVKHQMSSAKFGVGRRGQVH